MALSAAGEGASMRRRGAQREHALAEREMSILPETSAAIAATTCRAATVSQPANHGRCAGNAPPERPASG